MHIDAKIIHEALDKTEVLTIKWVLDLLDIAPVERVILELNKRVDELNERATNE
jgi:hypothetical protein